eukprot:c6221_g1_i1 orf=86-247(+)
MDREVVMEGLDLERRSQNMAECPGYGELRLALGEAHGMAIHNGLTKWARSKIF